MALKKLRFTVRLIGSFRSGTSRRHPCRSWQTSGQRWPEDSDFYAPVAPSIRVFGVPQIRRERSPYRFVLRRRLRKNPAGAQKTAIFRSPYRFVPSRSIAPTALSISAHAVSEVSEDPDSFAVGTSGSRGLRSASDPALARAGPSSSIVRWFSYLVANERATKNRFPAEIAGIDVSLMRPYFT
jgi:hypothetical protein